MPTAPENKGDNNMAMIERLPTRRSGSDGVQIRRLHAKKRKAYYMPNLSSLPRRQRDAVEALIGGGTDRTYEEAAKLSGMALGTLRTHLVRLKCSRPALYSKIMAVRKSQLAVRHEIAVRNAQAHSRQYFRNVNKQMRQLLGWSVWDLV